MHPRSLLAVLIAAALSSCVPVAGTTLVPLRIHVTSAASPWLPAVYECTPKGYAISLGGPSDAELVIRLTEPRFLEGPAYQIGSDDLLVVTHPQAAVGQLSVDQVQALFTGQLRNWRDVGGADLAVQVWAYAPTVDVQAFLDQTILHDRPISSLARLAVSTQDMSDSVGATPGSVGLLPRRWKTGNTREAFIVSAVPVLVLTDETPERPLVDLIACLQAQP